MLILKDSQIKKNLRFFLFLKIITIIIMIWIEHPYDDVVNNCLHECMYLILLLYYYIFLQIIIYFYIQFTCGSVIQNKYKEDSSLYLILKRYMSENIDQNELDRTGLYKNFPYNYDNKRINIYTDDTSIYGNIKNRDSKKLKLYKTGYNHRYAKKKGLSKLDCYYENKIFKKIDHIYNLADNWHSDKKFFKKKIMKEYGIPLILFALLPCLGLILLILFGDKKIGRGIIKICTNTESGHVSSDSCGGIHNFISQDTFNYIENANFVFSLLMIIIVIFVFIYIFLKVIKYERLKEGKGKMSKKEYFNYCKEVFNLK
ncbi:hypothetical protein PVMG_02551 [Plasmodium vivax Mauritania I]|uniref:Variable surface protein n=1 Tax=Plasmodium vivax Mauritania I TaxID=1035515 RepID=A0A0J9TIU7_PLAVI|nr:hypothetical protein PVMG_02551 [Plasmodium vivax Mauritania I]